MSPKPKQNQNILTLYIIFYGYGPLIFQLIMFRSKVLEKKKLVNTLHVVCFACPYECNHLYSPLPPHHYFR